MTGYGRGERSQDGFKIVVELNSVNRKQAEISLNLPREMELLEAQIRDIINQSVSRGRVTVRVSLHAGQSLEDGMRTLAEAGTDTAPVLDDGTATGLVTSRGILRAYRTAVSRGGPRTPFPAEA